MAIVYVDPDDEITGVIARIRRIEAGEAVLVLPAGSRIGTSRINFRLLARAGTERAVDVVVVSDDPQARALAISAGVPAYDSITAAEAALVAFRAQDAALADRTGRTGPEARPRLAPDDATRSMPAATGPASDRTGSLAAAAAARARRDVAPDETQTLVAPGIGVERAAAPPVARRRRSRALPLLAALLLVLIAAGVGYGAYLFLPTASITLQPHVLPVGPQEITIVADANVAVPDAAGGVIPAELVTVAVAVSDTFPATGVDVRQSRATGSVRFRSENTVFDVPIPEGTRVATAGGVDFETTQAVTLPRASFESGPTTVDAPVRAVRGGPRGNVEADTITRLPSSLRTALVSVRNPEPTSGGRRTEVAVVTQADYDGALAALRSRLPTELARALADPAVTPVGLTLFASSARLGIAVPDRPAEELVDTEVDEFALALESTATVLAVNEALVDQVARERLGAQVPAGATLIGEITSQHSAGTVVGTTVAYTATAYAAAYRVPDRAALLERLRGRSVAEARAIMAEYGTVQLTVWPEFIDRLPDQASRISLDVVPPTETE